MHLNSINRFQFRHKSHHPTFVVVANHWRLILLDTNECSQPEYDSAIFGVADTGRWSPCIVDICWWRHIIDDAVFVQWIADLCHVQRLWSTHNEIGSSSRSITAAVRDGHPGRLSWIVGSIYRRCIQCGAQFTVDLFEFDVGRCVGRFLQAIRQRTVIELSHQLHHALGCCVRRRHLCGTRYCRAENGHRAPVDHEPGGNYQWTAAGNIHHWHPDAVDQFKCKCAQTAFHAQFTSRNSLLFHLLECIVGRHMRRCCNVLGQFECTVGDCVGRIEIRAQSHVHQ